jgi:hypothetical protein
MTDTMTSQNTDLSSWGTLYSAVTKIGEHRKTNLTAVGIVRSRTQATEFSLVS